MFKLIDGSHIYKFKMSKEIELNWNLASLLLWPNILHNILSRSKFSFSSRKVYNISMLEYDISTEEDGCVAAVSR